jgi:hypothetical protein
MIQTARRIALVALLGWLCSAQPAAAQVLGFSISPSTIAFSSADPDTVPMMTAPPLTFTYTVLFSGGAGWRITAQAAGDLTNGAATIPISGMTWTASPNPPFRNGTMSRTVAQTVASGAGDVWNRSGTVVFSLANSWDYDVGVYSASIVFTLICP